MLPLLKSTETPIESIDRDSSVAGKVLNNINASNVKMAKHALGLNRTLTLDLCPDSALCHRVTRGSMTISCEDKDILLNQGDMIFLPKFKQSYKVIGHADFRHSSATISHSLTQRFQAFSSNGSRLNAITFDSAAILFEQPLSQRVLSLLPHYIVIRKDANRYAPNLKYLMSIMIDEAKHTSPGTDGTMKKLADLLTMTSIRSFFDSDSGKLEYWFSVYQNPKILQAVRAIQDSPAYPWSLDTLASHVGMSRTNFAVQFKQLVGRSPIDYLTEWRMSLAQTTLQNSDKTILSVAIEFGYHSESSFSRAFKKVTGYSPSEVRK